MDPSILIRRTALTAGAASFAWRGARAGDRRRVADQRGGYKSLIEALNAGAIDAWARWTQYMYLAVIQDHARILLDGRELMMRRLLGAIAALALCIQAAAAQGVLRVGDQIAGNRAVMEAAGVLQGLPYKIEWAQFSAAAPLLEALNAGALDVGFTGDVPFLFVYAAGAPVRVIGAVVSGAAANAIVVPKGSQAQSLRDLVGKRLAVNKGGNGHYLALSALQHAGIDPKSVTLVMLAPPEARLALNGGSVDAWAVWDPYISLAVMEDGGRVLADGTDAYLSETFDLARGDAIAAKADMIADFEHRLVQARRWALTHVAENAAQVSLQTRMPVAVVERSLRNRVITPIPLDDAAIAHTQAEADLFEKYHVLPQHIDMSGAFDRRFSGPSLAP